MNKHSLKVVICLFCIILVLLAAPKFFPQLILTRLPNTTQLTDSLLPFATTAPSLVVETVTIEHDEDEDGLPDLEDMVQGARIYINTKPRYKDAYYDGGYPPPEEGVCTDVIWQAFQAAGYDLKKMLDEDIKNNLECYPRVAGKADPNIDFRRVQNLHIFFKRHASELTLEIKPGDPENLKAWQGGDIVIFAHPLEHIAMVSNQRRSDGIPMLLHNAGPYATEADVLLRWSSPIIGHYRFPKS